MAYWWVSQNRTYRQERDGGYLWAPKTGANGATFHHWSNMTLVQPGDVIFSYANQSIGAIGTALSAAYDAPQPDEFGDTWNKDGWRVDVAYTQLARAVPLANFVDQLAPLLPDRNAPLTKNKTGVQGYLFSLPPKAGQFICDALDYVAPVDQLVADTLAQTVPDETTRDALVKARIGQGRWRRDLLRHWSGRCAVTGLDNELLLRASHIKPWRDCNNRERLDVSNGLILGPAYDAAFDAGLISFDDGGVIMISPNLSTDQIAAAGLLASARISALTDAHCIYLIHHRQSVFCG